jgi:aminoglycoside/choline kinase family phosphotransferase
MLEVVSSKGVEHLDWEEDASARRDKKKTKSTNPNDDSLITNPTNVTPMPSNPIELQEDNNSALLKQFANDKNADKKKKPEISDHDVLRESYKGSLFLVLEYVSHDLTGLLDMAYKFTEVQAKSLMMQLLNVLEYMHERKFVHRDLKSSNLLITQNFQVKLAVSGLTS